MISKNKLKELAAYRQQKRCDEEGLFVVEGPKMAAEAIASAFVVRTVCATADWIEEYGQHNLGGELYEVSEAELERLSNFRTPNRVWMLLERTPLHFDTTDGGGLVLALDHLQDPGNMGTIMRTADWFGVRHIFCSSDTVDCFNPKVVQASMGAIFRTRVDYVNLPQWLASCGMPVYGATLQGKPLHSLGINRGAPAVLLIGNESRGISPEAMACVSHPVLIPNRGGTAESLNASVAAGILIHSLIGQ